MISQPVKDESELETLLKLDIDRTSRNIKIMAGHLPLLYHEEEKKVELGVDRWGEFSLYTFEFGCRLVQYAKAQGKNASLVLIVDDDVELPREEVDGIMKRRDHNWARKPRKHFFETGKMPAAYSRLLDKYQLGVSDFITQERKSGVVSPLISEKILKRDALARGSAAPNECSLAYKGLLDDKRYFDAGNDYLISFMPGQCKGNICNGVLEVRTDIPATHIFFPHIDIMSGRSEIFDTRGNAFPVSEIYSIGSIVYRREK